MKTKKLSGRVALVTGASKGIGAAIARALAEEGASVAVNYSSSRDGAMKVVADIEASGGRAIAVQANVAKSGDIPRLFSETISAFGKLDILVNNAGIYQPAPIGSITEESFHAHFNLNVLGLILASQEAVKHFGTAGGVIVNISSVVALVTPPGIAVYNATKGAVDSVTRSFARELAGKMFASTPSIPVSSPRKEPTRRALWRRARRPVPLGRWAGRTISPRLSPFWLRTMRGGSMAKSTMPRECRCERT
jgi:3-oxoacyl-[acyl-carrier protein] reductase